MKLRKILNEIFDDSIFQKYPKGHKYDEDHKYAFTIYLPNGDKESLYFYSLSDAKKVQQMLYSDFGRTSVSTEITDEDGMTDDVNI